MELSQISKDYINVEAILQQRRDQQSSVKGKLTPYRVEFRYRGGGRSYQYFADLISARCADDRIVRYGFSGRAIIEYPSSQQIQVEGPRGGWKKFIEAE